jgi:polysaccharide pyruvyl transferase WcaK-like protein
MKMDSTKPSILLLSGDLAGNTGDRAIRCVLIERIRAVAPDANIFAVSREPKRDEAEFGVKIVARNAFSLLGMPLFLSSLTTILFGGGQLLQDDSSQIKNIHWATVLNGIRLISRRPILGCGLGIGPLDTPMGRLSAKRALRALDGCLARDERSAAWARRFMSQGAPLSVAPDPALALAPRSRSEALSYLTETERVPFNDSELIVGVAVRRFFPGRRGILPSAWTSGAHDDTQTFDRFKQHLAIAINRFAGIHKNMRILFFPFYRASWQNDADHAREIARHLDCPSHVLSLNCSSSMVKSLQGLCELFIGVPMHSVILAIGAGVPTLGIAYADKTLDLYATIGLKDHIMSIEHTYSNEGADHLYHAVSRLYSERIRIRSTLNDRWPQLEQQIRIYDNWLGTAIYARTLPVAESL